MKRVLVLLDDKSQLSDESIDYIQQFAKEEDATIVDVIKHPRGFITRQTNLIIDALKELQIDTVISLGPEFVINELANGGNVSKRFAEENIKIIEGTMRMELSEAIELMPSNIKASIRQFVNQDFLKRDNVLVFTTDSDSSNSITYTEELLGRNSINIIVAAKLPSDHEMEEMEEMGSIIHKIINKHEIDKIVVYNSPESPKFNDLLEDLSDIGIDVIHKEEQEMDMLVSGNSYFCGMKMS